MQARSSTPTKINDWSQPMRQGCALALTILMPLISSALRAQDPSEDWAADSMATDSSEYETEIADTTLRRPRGQRESGTNPYLREVREQAEPVYWASMALGAGSRAFSYSGVGQKYGPTSTGATLSIEVGRRFNPHVGFGLEYLGWLGDIQDDFFGALQSLMAIARVHPFGPVGPFLKAGGGLATYTVYDMVYDDIASLDLGATYLLGAGWDIPTGGKLVISPIIEWQHYALTSDRTYHGRLLNFGLMISFSGRESDLDQYSSEE
jgi:hypothetical protein